MKRVGFISVLGVLAIALLASLIIRVRGLSSAKEREHIYHAGFSHTEIIKRVGSVRNVSVALKTDVPFFAKGRDDWTRNKSSGAIVGEVRLWIIGSRDGGFFRMTYTFVEGEGTFTVNHLDSS